MGQVVLVLPRARWGVVVTSWVVVGSRIVAAGARLNARRSRQPGGRSRWNSLGRCARGPSWGLVMICAMAERAGSVRRRLTFAVHRLAR